MSVWVIVLWLMGGDIEAYAFPDKRECEFFRGKAVIYFGEKSDISQCVEVKK